MTISIMHQKVIKYSARNAKQLKNKFPCRSEKGTILIKMMDTSHSSELTSATMQKSLAACNIFETFLTFYNISSCAGFVPFKVKLKDGNINIQKRSVYNTAFFLSLYSAALLVLCILGQQEPDAEESQLIRYGNYSLYLQLVSIAIFVVLFNYLKRRKIANCLVVMHHFDCMIQVGQMSCALHSNAIEENLFYILQSMQDNMEINHLGQRRMISRFLMKGFVLFAGKTVGSFYILDENERNFPHLLSLAIYILFTEISALIIYQFIFFAYCVKCRYEVLVAYAEKHFGLFQNDKSFSNSNESTKLLEDLAYLHSQLAEALEIINATFSIEVSCNAIYQSFINFAADFLLISVS